MPVLIAALRNYGLREYGLTLSIAVICGLGLAALLNASAGGKGGEATLKTKAQIEAQSSRILTTRVSKPVRAAHPVRRHRAHVRRHHRSHTRSHYVPPPPPKTSAPTLVAVRTPAPRPAPKPVTHVAPKPVVRVPAPRQKPAAAPKKKSGGSLQFDDSG